MKRTFLAALLGGVALFVWAGLSHSVLLIGAGFSPLPEEDKIVSTSNQLNQGEGPLLLSGQGLSPQHS